jgi:hypothetical protein
MECVFTQLAESISFAPLVYIIKLLSVKDFASS